MIPNPGKQCVLSAAEENVLIDYIKLMSSKKMFWQIILNSCHQMGIHWNAKNFVMKLKKVLDHDGRKTPFKNNLPDKHWCQLFGKRHPELSERSAMALGHQRSLINYDMIESWFNGLILHLKKTCQIDNHLWKIPDDSLMPMKVVFPYLWQMVKC